MFDAPTSGLALYVTVDGQPANALPQDENGAALVLTSPDPAEDYITIEPVARNLAPGRHTMTVTASRGWDQWALNGFSVGYISYGIQAAWWFCGLPALSIFLLILAIVAGRRADWGSLGELDASIYRPRWRSRADDHDGRCRGSSYLDRLVNVGRTRSPACTGVSVTAVNWH